MVLFFHKTPLHLAVELAKHPIIEILLKRNDIDINAVDEIL